MTRSWLECGHYETMAEMTRMIRPTIRFTTQETTYTMEKTRRYKEVVMVEREGNENGGAFSFEFNGLYMNDCGASGTQQASALVQQTSTD